MGWVSDYGGVCWLLGLIRQLGEACKCLCIGMYKDTYSGQFPILGGNSYSTDNEQDLCHIVQVDHWVDQNSCLPCQSNGSLTCPLTMPHRHAVYDPRRVTDRR